MLPEADRQYEVPEKWKECKIIVPEGMDVVVQIVRSALGFIGGTELCDTLDGVIILKRKKGEAVQRSLSTTLDLLERTYQNIVIEFDTE